jgi:uncharacterized protein
MKRFLVAIAMMAVAPAFAQGQPASEESIRDLMMITNSKALLEQTYDQLDGMIEKSMDEAMAGKKGTAEQQKLTGEMRAKMVELIRTELGWEKLEPAYIKLYASTFSQAEIDGMNAFYKSEAGQAVIAKMP